MANLIVESGSDKRKIFSLAGQDKFVCGRSVKADLLINDPFASGQHFSLAHKDGAWYIHDLESSNGVEVNEEKVKTCKLADNDIIHVGSTYLRFIDPDTKQQEVVSNINFPTVQGYEIIDRLGVGGMGEVYRARQISLDREVALKVLFKHLTRDQEFVRKFFQEARAAGNLNHPNIVQVHDVGDDNGVFFICMEYVSGGNLSDLLRKNGSLDESTVIRVAIEVAKGLAYAQSKNLVHCDIKPDNIMFSDSGMAKIADLGIARHASDAQTQQSEVLGSPHYMAPEQAMGKPLDHRADLYSLGCTMYRMLAGRTPFSGTSAREVMKKQVIEDAPDILKYAPNVSAQLADVIDCLMEKAPEKRLQSANDLINVLEKISAGAEKKKTGPAPARLHRSPARDTKVRAPLGARAASRKKSSKNPNNNIILGIMVFAIVILGILVYPLAADYKASSVFVDAQKNYAVGNYPKCLELLEPIDFSKVKSKELAQKIRELRNNAEKRQAEEKKAQEKERMKVDAQERFNRDIAHFHRALMRKKANPVAALQRKLDEMKLTYKEYPELLRKIALEEQQLKAAQ